MKVFKDNKDREWSIAVNVWTMIRVKDNLDVDLATVIDGSLMEKLDDPLYLYSVLWQLCIEEAEEKGVTKKQFCEGLYGDSIKRATDCLTAELVDFFHGNQRRVLEEMLVLKERGQNIAMQKIETILASPRIRTAMDAMMERAEKESEKGIDLLISGK